MNSTTLAASDGSAPQAPPADALAPARPIAHVHVPALDGVRGTAILLVLLGHLTESITWEWEVTFPLMQVGFLGWSGVDLFFVLSGFLITGILYEAKGKARYFRNFYARRSLRIFPLYYLALTVLLVAALALPGLALLGWENSAWLWIYATNYKIAFGEAGMFGTLDHFWSLAVEEHFYLVWPAIVLAFNRRTLMIIAGIAIVIALGVRIACIQDGEMSMAGYMMTHARMDALAAGALIALTVRGPRGIKPLAVAAPYVLAASGALLAAIVFGRQTTSYHDPLLGTIGLSLLWAFFGSILVLSLTWKPTNFAMSQPAMRWLGKYSYGLYVWHPPIFIFLLHKEWVHGFRTGNVLLDIAIGVGTALAVTLAVSLASYHLIEKRVLKLKNRFE